MIEGISSNKGICFSDDRLIVKAYYIGEEIIIKSKPKKFKKRIKSTKNFYLSDFVVSVIFTFLISVTENYPIAKLGIIIGGPLITFLYLLYMQNSEVSKFHAAEHKAINAFINNKEVNLENIMSQNRVAVNCGINYIIYCFFWGIALLIINVDINFHTAFLIFIYTVVINKAYYSANPNIIILIKPFKMLGEVLQKQFTTREPDLKHLLLAEKAINVLITYTELEYAE